MKHLIIIVSIFFTSYHAIAQTMASIPSPKQDVLHSKIVGEDYYLKITLPFPFNPAQKKYPVLIYLDAFGSSAGMNELAMSKMFSNSFEKFVMVGISYNVNMSIPGQYGELRSRDYVPPLNKMDTIHGGDKFLSFIKTELIPYMENNYGTNPNDRGLLGFSYGGLFTTWAFKEEPKLFQRLAILSPSLWYGKDEFILDNSVFLDSVKNTKNLKVFISYGSLESPDFKAPGKKLVKILKTNKNIQVSNVIFEDENHDTVWNAATTRALFNLYGNPFKALIKESKKYYRAKDFKKALKNYEMAFKKYPKQTNEGDRYDIACIYALVGDADNAFKYLQMLINSKKDIYKHTLNDSDLNTLHDDNRWRTLLNGLKKKSKN